MDKQSCTHQVYPVLPLFAAGSIVLRVLQQYCNSLYIWIPFFVCACFTFLTAGQCVFVTFEFKGS